MRMWLVDPKLMCNQHLLGEHCEMHAFIGTIIKGTSIEGYINKGLIEVDKIYERHSDLADEMTQRGMKHKSPLPFMVINQFWLRFNNPGKVNIEANLVELSNRCPKCRKRIEGVIDCANPN